MWDVWRPISFKFSLILLKNLRMNWNIRARSFSSSILEVNLYALLLFSQLIYIPNRKSKNSLLNLQVLKFPSCLFFLWLLFAHIKNHILPKWWTLAFSNLHLCIYISVTILVLDLVYPFTCLFLLVLIVSSTFAYSQKLQYRIYIYMYNAIETSR